MITWRWIRIAAVLGCLPAAACQSGVSGDADPMLATQPAPVVASTQRLGPDGYPLLGAMPTAATRQMSNAEVVHQRSALQTSARATTAAGARSGTPYGQSIAQLTAARRQANAAAASGSSGSAARRIPTPEEVLQEIESGS
ncbi:hypothetical protein [Consotaella aegiceratis]|uniref:hypothetical protein n=1 Tax=Consotaella aegiceratis TaxID=3097961 RepID=UPI002F422839